MSTSRRIHVVIPTRDRYDLLEPLVEELIEQDEFVRLHVYDQGGDALVHLPWHERLNVMGVDKAKTITETWNGGWRRAISLENFRWWEGADGVDVAFLNDDIRIPPNFLSRLSSALHSDDKWWCVYPDYHRGLSLDDSNDTRVTETEGTYKDGGLWGCAFMLRGELLHEGLHSGFDEQFQWWCGDDDLVRRIGEGGGSVGRVEGLALEHIGTATGNLHPELHEIGRQDLERYAQKWGRS